MSLTSATNLKFWDDDGRPVTDYDIHQDVNEIDHDAAFREIRETNPVVWSPLHGGHWIISKHQDVARVLKDPATFSSARNEVTGDNSPLQIPSLPVGFNYPQELDPPEFYSYRRLLNGILSPKVVQRELVPRVHHWVDWYIDEVIELGECDLVKDLTGPVAAAVALEWLGFPPDEWHRMAEAVHNVVSYENGSAEQAVGIRDMNWTSDRISEEVAIRRERYAAGDSPGDDAIAYLATQQVDGALIESKYAEAMVRILVNGGVDTTTAASTSSVVHLHFHPDQRERLRTEPELWDTAVDELIRRFAPVRGLARTVMTDTEVNGCPLRAGDRVWTSERSACHDDDEFPQADEVILDRFPNRHVAFGLEPHRCAGMHLARATFRYLVSQIIERMPDYRVDEDALRPYAQQANAAGWISAPLTFTPGRASEHRNSRPGDSTPGKGATI